MSYPYGQWSNPFDACHYHVQNPYGTPSPCNPYTTYSADNTTCWVDLLRLRSQRDYLEDQLSKTAVTLHSLRSKQNRNEKTLSTNPTPRSKRKKVLQNRWRTDKTIKSCETNEMTILGNLQVCNGQIFYLESMIALKDFSMSSPNLSFASTRGSCPPSATTEFSWNYWTDEATVSPYQKQRIEPFLADDVPPEVFLDEGAKTNGIKFAKEHKQLPALKIDAVAQMVTTTEITPTSPPYSVHNERFHTSTLSPEAAVFEPCVLTNDLGFHEKDQDAMDVDSTLDYSTVVCGAETMQVSLKKRRFSEDGMGGVFSRLSEEGTSTVEQEKMNPASDSRFVIPVMGRRRATSF